MAATEELHNAKVAGKAAAPPGRAAGARSIIESIIQLAGISAIVIIALIFFFLLREGLPTFLDIPLRQLFGSRWYPIEDSFGLAAACSSARCW